MDRNKSQVGYLEKKSNVAPLAGAWIEILLPFAGKHGMISRSPCGSVDRNKWDASNADYDLIVAPLAGAWIEMSMTQNT